MNYKPIVEFFGRHRHLARITKLGLGVALLDSFVLSYQQQISLRAAVRGFTNAATAFPIVGSCVYDYVSTLRPLEYPTEKYLEARKGCHERSADKILYLATHCGGIYYKAG